MADNDNGDHVEAAEESRRSRRSKFRFKSSRKEQGEETGSDRSKKRRRSSSPLRHGHRRKRKHKGDKPDDPSQYDDTYLPNSRSSQYMDPDEAFRESLFDALADDEGAAYWEGVYGQPIHVFPREKKAEGGALEEMTDEEYATYVRQKMWEKSHQHILEERKRREEELKKQRETEQKSQEDFEKRKAWDNMIEESLRFGRKRKENQNWRVAWTSYLDKWEQFLEKAGKGNNGNNSKKHSQQSKACIPWPVLSGNEEHVNKDAVESFFHKNPADDLLTILKAERVRWHPDKMQQRLRAAGLDSSALPRVTAVFQILDNMWTDLKKNST